MGGWAGQSELTSWSWKGRMGRQKPCSNGVAGPRQHNHHAMQVVEDVSHPLQDYLLLHDGLGTEAQDGGSLPGTAPPHTHILAVYPQAHLHPSLSLTLCLGRRD